MQLIDDAVEQHVRMVECCLLSDEPAKAHAAVDRAFSAMREARGRSITVHDAVGDLVHPRIAGMLDSQGIYTVGDLIEKTREELKRFPQMKYRSIDLIEDALKAAGFELRKTVLN